MTCDLFIVTFARDFSYLKYCLLSIAKFVRRFSYLRILVPMEDVAGTEKLVEEAQFAYLPVKVIGYQEKPGKGMIWHMRQIMHAETFTDGQMIAHLDADCIFIKPTEPTDFLAADGKIILRYEPFASIGKRHAGMLEWQRCTQACLPFPVKNETMRCHPGVFHRTTYELARKLMEQHTKQPVDDYLLAQRNEFPQTFCEFNTLGNVALERQLDLYLPIRQKGDPTEPPTPIQQFWGHGPITGPQEVWVRGKPNKIVPLQMIESILA
jgi:hypothetical protein